MTDIVETSDDYRVLLRRPRSSDQSYVASTWAHSLRSTGRAGVGKPDALIDRMLDNSAVKVMLAVEPSDDERILGWIAYTAMPRAIIVHYVYVRDKVRGRGIAHALL